MSLTKHEMAAIVARDIPQGAYVNLGIGQPTLVADHLPAGSGVVLHTENGMPNMGPDATCEQTGVGCVDRVYTDLATFQLGPGGAVVLETFGISYDEPASSVTGCLPAFVRSGST